MRAVVFKTNQKNPARGVETVVNVKPTVRRKNIIVGEFAYFADKDFEGYVTHHYKFNDHKLILGKLQWWNKSIEEIDELIPILTNSDLEYVKAELKKLV